MQKPLIRILFWLGLMAVLTALAMGLWFWLFQGSQSTESLKWLQLLQTIATFLLPALLGAWVWDENHRPFTWLHMDKGAQPKVCALAVLMMVCAIPGINLLADLNSRVALPESLGFIEQILKQQEEAATALTERFLQTDTIRGMLLNMALMALLPAMVEEVSFRGTLQQLLGNKHAAIWATAFIFSAIHMQFYGFIPRMLMGAMFGYMFVWTGSLWVPVLMHFTNNGLAVLVYYVMGENADGKNYADTLGAGTTWWLGVISLIVVCGLLYLITSPDLLRCGRRTHRQ